MQTWVEPYSYSAQRNAGKHFSRFGTIRTLPGVSDRCRFLGAKEKLCATGACSFVCAPGANPREGAAAPFLAGGDGVSKGEGESERLALWRAFASLPRAGKGTAPLGRAVSKTNKLALRLRRDMVCSVSGIF